jgi:hypothetical protein
MQGRGNHEILREILIEEVQKSSSVELLEAVTRQMGDVTIHILVFEKFYMRSSNWASLSVILTAEKDVLTVDAMGSGGGQGLIFNLSWGAEEDFVSVVESILLNYSFTTLE